MPLPFWSEIAVIYHAADNEAPQQPYSHVQYFKIKAFLGSEHIMPPEAFNVKKNFQKSLKQKLSAYICENTERVDIKRSSKSRN